MHRVNINIVIMTMWRPHLDGKTGPKYRLIANAIGEAATDGRLAPGERLPTQRQLADELGISLNTVSRAYAQAVERGFLCGEVGRGTYVRAPGPLSASPSHAPTARRSDGPIDFTLNLPATGEGAVLLARTLISLGATTTLSPFLDFQTDADMGAHAQAAATWIGRLGLGVAAADVILTNGAQHGLMVALLATTRPGDVLLTESLTYAPITTLARHLGLKVFPVAMDGQGLSPEALETACASTAAKTLYCLPTLHTPTAITMNVDRRRAIAEVAERRGLTIIEDDVFGYLPDDRPPPLASFAPHRTLFVTSVSKSLAPGLRVGYLHAQGKWRHALRAAVNLSCWMPPPLMAEIASRWIADGSAERLNEFQRGEARARQRIARGILGAHGPMADTGGLHVWLPLPAHWRAEAFRTAAERQGVKVLTGETFAVRPKDAPQAVRLCLSHESTRARVTRGLEIVAGLLAETNAPGMLVV